MKTHVPFRCLFTVTSLAAVLMVPLPNGYAEAGPDEGRQQLDAVKTRVDALDETHGRVNGKPSVPPPGYPGGGSTSGSTATVKSKQSAATHTYDIVIANRLLMHDGKADAATLGLVVEELRKIQPQANIVLAAGLMDVPVGDLKLHAHNVIEVLQALRVATDDRFDWWGSGSLEPNRPGPNQAGAIDVQTGLPLAPAATDPNSGLFTLREPVKAGDAETVVEAFNIGPYLNIQRSEPHDIYGRDSDERKQKIDGEIVDKLESLLIDTVARFRQEAKQILKFQYHQGATLLIVIGPKSDVEVVRKVMNALTTDPTGGKVTGGSHGDYAPEQPVSVESIPLKGVPMDIAYTAANSLLTEKRSKVVVADERSKTLIVSGTKTEVAAIRKAIEQLGATKPYVGDFPTTEGKPAGK